MYCAPVTKYKYKYYYSSRIDSNFAREDEADV